MRVPGSTRSRGIRLTIDAIETLERKLQGTWSDRGERGKLTRRRKAEILQLSEKTTDRLLLGERVDRATVALAFKTLGIEWDEKLLVPEVQEFEAVAPKRSNNRWWLAAGSLVALSLGALALRPPAAAFAQASKVGKWRAGFFVDLEHGTQLFHSANYPEAKTVFDGLAELARRNDDVGCEAEAVRMQGDVSLAQGNAERALSFYQSALALRERSGTEVTYAAIQQAIGVTQIRLKHYGEAKTMLTKSLDGFVKASNLDGMTSVQRDLGELCAATGDDQSALAWFASARSAMGRSLNMGLLMDVRSQEALIFCRQGDCDKARKVLLDCREYWVKNNHPRWIALMDLRLAKVELAAGRDQAAKGYLASSVSGYRGVGDEFGVATAAQELNLISGKLR